jgi:Family of unknown function (DUF6312)
MFRVFMLSTARSVDGICDRPEKERLAVRTLPGVKRVTMLSPMARRHVLVGAGNGHAAERVKSTVIRPSGEVERGEMRVDIGPLKRERRHFRPIERRVRRMVRAEYRALGRYLELHDRSRRRRRSGWVGDLPRNIAKVIRRST